MPDFTMCSDTDCHRRHTCLRYIALPDKHQSYFIGTPDTNDYDACTYYMQPTKKHKDRYKERVRHA